jgi:hypothetical protein
VHKKAFYGVSKGLITGEDRNFVYVEPSIKVRVRFRNWTILIVLAVTNPNEDDFANYAIKQSSDSSFEGFLNELGGSVFKAITSSNDYVFFTVFTVNAVFEQKKVSRYR